MSKRELHEGALTASVIGCFFEVYNNLGFGYPEYLYTLALERELRSRGHAVAREVGVTVMYKREELGMFRLDMLVDERLVVEVKATELLHPSALRQLFNYLKSTRLEIGLLLHFGRQPKFYRIVCLDAHKRPPSR